MDLSKLSANEKLATYGAVAAVIGGLVAALTYRTYGSAWIAVLAGLAVLAVVFLPQQRPGTSLPGSKGTLLLIAGGLAGVLMLLMLLTTIGFTFVEFGVADILWLIAVAGSVVMAWAGWQEFQAEGGKFQLGTASDSGAAAAPPADAAAPSAPPATPPQASAPPASSPPPAEPPAGAASSSPDEPLPPDDQRPA